MKQSKALIAGVFAGLSAPASMGVPAEYPRLVGSDLNRLRGDVQRVGRDFETVIKKKNGEARSPRSTEAG